MTQRYKRPYTSFHGCYGEPTWNRRETGIYNPLGTNFGSPIIPKCEQVPERRAPKNKPRKPRQRYFEFEDANLPIAFRNARHERKYTHTYIRDTEGLKLHVIYGFESGMQRRFNETDYNKILELCRKWGIKK
jgi:hypothetical protein